MSILSELQTRKLGLIELMLMGFDVYLKNLKPILLMFCSILLPFLIILSALITQRQNNTSGLFLAFYYIYYIFVQLPVLIYWIAISVFTENYVYARNTSYQSVVKKIFVNLIPLFFLSLRFLLNCYIRLLLLVIPGIIYSVNNQYYALAFILRDRRGKAALAYSRFIVKGNWWKVFLFSFLGCTIFSNGLYFIFSKLLSNIPFISDFLVSILSQILPNFIVIGIGIGSILLFLNLDYQKSLES